MPACLLSAAKKGNVAEVARLLRDGADISCTDTVRGWSSLFGCSDLTRKEPASSLTCLVLGWLHGAA